MCFDPDSRPPIAPIAGGALDSHATVLEAADGNRFEAFVARAAEHTGAGIVILPDVRGLHTYYRELALRFAEHGVDAVAMDWFGRSAGIGDRGDDFDFMSHVKAMQYEETRADIAATAAHLRTEAGTSSLFTIGFCMGGRLAFLSGTHGLGLAGAIGMYGWPTGASRGTPAPVDVAGEMANPVLAIFGGADEGIGLDAPRQFDEALAAAGIEHRVTVYPGAPHSFFDRKAADFAEASARAWDEVLAFIREHTAS